MSDSKKYVIHEYLMEKIIESLIEDEKCPVPSDKIICIYPDCDDCWEIFFKSLEMKENEKS